jgi:hypothetical protein
MHSEAKAIVEQTTVEESAKAVHGVCCREMTSRGGMLGRLEETQFYRWVEA